MALGIKRGMLKDWEFCLKGRGQETVKALHAVSRLCFAGTSLLMYPEAGDRDGEAEDTQCRSTLGFVSISRLFAEQKQSSAGCHFPTVHLQRNYLSISIVCLQAVWCESIVPGLAGCKLGD